VARIVATAHRTNRLPSEVYREFLDHRWDYRLLWAYEDFKSEREQEAIDKANKGSGSTTLKSPRGFG